MSLQKNNEDRKSNRDANALQRPAADRSHGDDDRSATRCALLTGAGRSAIAVIVLQGPHSHDLLHRCFRRATDRTLQPGEIRYGTWTGPEPTTAGESVVVTPIDTDHFEIHCHGGAAATARILQDLRDCGAQIVATSQWHDDPSSPLLSEANWVLQRCLTARTAAIALAQVNGALQRWATSWRDRLATTPHDQTADTTRQLNTEAHQMLRSARVTTRMTQPLRLVLVGPPNVGKSSLMNAIVGYERSITLDEAGTTRDVLHADTVIDGMPFQLSDTAGLRSGGETIEQMGMQRAKEAAASADLVLQVTEPARLADPAAHDRDRQILDAVKSQAPVIRVLNKADLQATQDPPADCDLAVSALRGDGIDQLMQRLADAFTTAMPEADAPAILNERQDLAVRQIADCTDPAQLQQWLHRLLGQPDSTGESS